MLRFARTTTPITPSPSSIGGTSKGMKYSKSMPSLSALVAENSADDALSTCSNEGPSVLGCLKVHTHDDSLQKSYQSDELESKRVGFSTVEVRSHAMILGDNPSVSSGPPVTIDWKHQGVTECDLTQYEESKPMRRSKSEIALPAHLREAWLREQGYGSSELARASKEVKKVKKGRSAAIRELTQPSSIFSRRRRSGSM
jgi:hypothetical protein